ncbi:helix-turn-helix domain-containing protein [Conexibacter sp. CPCC 206217]|uniref:helix-turn-helix domain-containing protein n=1 Tax=Conexibacter sp. CPCC 206217 TaxID=3064574 RepID=UPI002722F033|nr:helix-turn-helix transcriptional regulator [Conexibacter sp. CPCC 206217]MDO8213523.1 helix-turn-helix transcriptional regulator [Conexibacter sp. CPCC 206217]
MARELVPARVALGRAVAVARVQPRLTQHDLSRAAGLGKNAVGAIESGRGDPSWTTLRAVADALGLDLSALLRVAEQIERGEPMTFPRRDEGRRAAGLRANPRPDGTEDAEA